MINREDCLMRDKGGWSRNKVKVRLRSFDKQVVTAELYACLMANSKELVVQMLATEWGST